MGSVDYGGMSEAVAPSLRSLQQTANEHVLANYGEDVYDHYQSLVTESKRIPAQIKGSGLASISSEPIVDSIAALERSGASTEVAEQVGRTGGMAKRTLSGILSAGETAAEVMRFIK
jgi:hypothetical protein